MLALLPDAFGGSAQVISVAVGTLVIFLGLHILMMLGEVCISHTTDNARYAARLISHGPFRGPFWVGAVFLGGVLPTLLLVTAASNRVLVGLASVLALAGLLIFEWCFVMAGQSVPNS